jgi:hypothetical protein
MSKVYRFKHGGYWFEHNLGSGEVVFLGQQNGLGREHRLFRGDTFRLCVDCDDGKEVELLSTSYEELLKASREGRAKEFYERESREMRRSPVLGDWLLPRTWAELRGDEEYANAVRHYLKMMELLELAEQKESGVRHYNPGPTQADVEVSCGG